MGAARAGGQAPGAPAGVSAARGFDARPGFHESALGLQSAAPVSCGDRFDSTGAPGRVCCGGACGCGAGEHLVRSCCSLQGAMRFWCSGGRGPRAPSSRRPAAAGAEAGRARRARRGRRAGAGAAAAAGARGKNERGRAGGAAGPGPLLRGARIGRGRGGVGAARRSARVRARLRPCAGGFVPRRRLEQSGAARRPRHRGRRPAGGGASHAARPLGPSRQHGGGGPVGARRVGWAARRALASILHTAYCEQLNTHRCFLFKRPRGGGARASARAHAGAPPRHRRDGRRAGGGAGLRAAPRRAGRAGGGLRHFGAGLQCERPARAVWVSASAPAPAMKGPRRRAQSDRAPRRAISNGGPRPPAPRARRPVVAVRLCALCCSTRDARQGGGASIIPGRGGAQRSAEQTENQHARGRAPR